MIEPATHPRRGGIEAAVGLLCALYAATFFLGALLHLGVRIPLGFASSPSPGYSPPPSSSACAGWRSPPAPTPCSPEGAGHGRWP